jgi:hypothetical protein
MGNSIDLDLWENSQMEPESKFMNVLGEKPLGFITDGVERRNVSKGTEFMVTRCSKSNRRSSITPPYVQSTCDKVFGAYVMRTPQFFIPPAFMMNR